MKREMTKSLQKNIHELEEKLNIGKSFDVVERRLTVAGKEACLYFVDGFVKDDTMEHIMEFFYQNTDDNIVKVRLQGHCAGCPGAQMTIKGVVERILKESYPEIAGVEAVN